MEKKLIILVVLMLILATCELRAQNQVYFPDDTTEIITFEEETITPSTSTSVDVTVSPQVIYRTWDNLEPGLKSIITSTTKLSSDIDPDDILYIYEVSNVPCYGTIWFSILKNKYNVSRTNPVEEDIDPVMAINIKGCQSGNDDGSSINVPIGNRFTIPRRKNQ